MIRDCQGDKLIGHVSRDATAIPARQNADEKTQKACKSKASPKKAVRQKAVRHSPSTGELKRRDIQARRTMVQNVSDPPRQCDNGVKWNSMGHDFWWTNNKLDIDTMDGDNSLSAILTSAFQHDSQAGVPLIQISTDRCSILTTSLTLRMKLSE